MSGTLGYSPYMYSYSPGGYGSSSYDPNGSATSYFTPTPTPVQTAGTGAAGNPTINSLASSLSSLNLGQFFTDAFGFGGTGTTGATATSTGFNGAGIVEQQQAAMNFMNQTNVNDQNFISNTGAMAYNTVSPIIQNTNLVLGNALNTGTQGLSQAAQSAANNAGGQSFMSSLFGL